MAHSPTMLPDPYGPANPLAIAIPKKETILASDSSITKTSSTLAGQGIEGTVSLDLILHDIAERGRQATGASGAAIAIQQDAEMVCRAAAGTTVPDLGSRINVQFGLS